MRRFATSHINTGASRQRGGSLFVRRVRLAILLLFMLATGLSAWPAAHAMAAGADLTAVVLCSGDGARTVYLDADGAPASPASDCSRCPVCVAASVQALAPTPQAMPCCARRTSAATRLRDAVTRALRHPRPQSRGPPAVQRAAEGIGLYVPADAEADSTKVNFETVLKCQSIGRNHKDARP